MKSNASLPKSLFLAATGIALGAAAIAASAQNAPLSKPKRANWSAMVTETDGGHLLGNPDAPKKLVEFMSYTCSHCADFARGGEGAIKLAYVPTGKLSLEIRHLVRDPVDLAATLLTQCGEPSKFPANHAAIILKQEEWFAKARAATQAQRARWQFGTHSARFQAIASDLGFYDIMETRGYERTELDRCLSDEAKASAIAEQSRADTVRYALQGTPSFVLNGALLENTHQWETLRPFLDRTD